MIDLVCRRCGAEDSTGPVYLETCACGELWSAPEPEPPVSPFSPRTPLWSDPADDGLIWKREDLTPTGSFKDRGAERLAETARRAGATSLVLDSSGSAALAAARVAALIGLPLELHTPESLAPLKRSAITCFGAHLVARGDRAAAAHRARAAAKTAFWFSHVYHPAFALGTALSGFEALEDPRASGDTRWIVPVGNGSLLLGLHQAILARGGSGPRLIAVQTAAAPGLVRPGAPAGPTRAHGIAISDPPRRAQILAAIDDTGGEVLVVDEEEIGEAWCALAGRGLRLEAASAAALAGARRLRARGENAGLVAWATGSGARD